MKRKAEYEIERESTTGRTRVGEELVRNKQFELNVVNSHDPQDDRITMNEELHLYYIDDIHLDIMVSATGFIHKYFEEFDQDMVIKGMIEKGRTKDIKDIYFGLSVDMIKNKWKCENSTASALGTELHARIERYYAINSYHESKDKELGKAWEYFKAFDNDIMIKQGWKIYRTEWMIFIEELLLTGSVDGVVQIDPINNPKHVVIVDWKRSKEIKKTGFRNKKGKGICSDLQDCNLFHYHLQLSLYRYIIENYYGMEVIASYILIFHPNQETYDKIPVVDLRKSHIEKMLDERKNVITQWKELQKNEMSRTNSIEDLKFLNII